MPPGNTTTEEVESTLLRSLVHGFSDFRVSGDGTNFADPETPFAGHEPHARFDKENNLLIVWCNICSPNDGGRVNHDG